MSMITDLTDHSSSLISCEPKLSPFYSSLPVINQISACTFDYPLCPYYIDIIVPSKHKYKFDYGARHVLVSWDGYDRITCYSSDPEKDGKIIYDQEHRASMVYSDYSETLYLE